MKKRVLDVGQCVPDHAAIRRLLERNFDTEVAQAHSLSATLDQLRSDKIALVLVNRKLDADGSDGLEVIRAIKSDPTLATVPVMLVSNYSQCQHEAEQFGAERGFGKAELASPETHARLGRFLDEER